MSTTPELRIQFEKAFSKIMKTLSPEFQNKWDGIITWNDKHSYPEIQSTVIQGLPIEAKAIYVTLLNKLSRGKM
jgi:hypothetical protein